VIRRIAGLECGSRTVAQLADAAPPTRGAPTPPLRALPTPTSAADGVLLELRNHVFGQGELAQPLLHLGWAPRDWTLVWHGCGCWARVLGRVQVKRKCYNTGLGVKGSVQY
jgi:hypothetical protein